MMARLPGLLQQLDDPHPGDAHQFRHVLLGHFLKIIVPGSLYHQRLFVIHGALPGVFRVLQMFFAETNVVHAPSIAPCRTIVNHSFKKLALFSPFPFPARKQEKTVQIVLSRCGEKRTNPAAPADGGKVFFG